MPRYHQGKYERQSGHKVPCRHIVVAQTHVNQQLDRNNESCYGDCRYVVFIEGPSGPHRNVSEVSVKETEAVKVPAER